MGIERYEIEHKSSKKKKRNGNLDIEWKIVLINF